MASIEHDLFIEEWQATPTKVMLVLKDYNYSSQADRHRPLDRFNLKDREAGYHAALSCRLQYVITYEARCRLWSYRRATRKYVPPQTARALSAKGLHEHPRFHPNRQTASSQKRNQH